MAQNNNTNSTKGTDKGQTVPAATQTEAAQPEVNTTNGVPTPNTDAKAIEAAAAQPFGEVGFTVPATRTVYQNTRGEAGVSALAATASVPMRLAGGLLVVVEAGIYARQTTGKAQVVTTFDVAWPKRLQADKGTKASLIAHVENAFSGWNGAEKCQTEVATFLANPPKADAPKSSGIKAIVAQPITPTV